MNQELRKDAKQIIDEAIASVQPDAAVRRALSNLVFSEHVYIVAIGKAGWQMANAAVSYLQENGIKYEKGIVITKYHHVMGQLSKPILWRVASYCFPGFPSPTTKYIIYNPYIHQLK